MLAAGGNALDAAIATNAMLTVVYPHMCGLGGDLFLLYHEARTGTTHCLNGTGGAPGLATPAAFAERGLDAVPVRGPLSVSVPGTVGAWEEALTRFGSLPLADALAPAADRAAAGIDISPRIAGWIAAERDASPPIRCCARGSWTRPGRPCPPAPCCAGPSSPRRCAGSPTRAPPSSTAASSAGGSPTPSRRPAVSCARTTCAPTVPSGPRRSPRATAGWTS